MVHRKGCVVYSLIAVIILINLSSRLSVFLSVLIMEAGFPVGYAPAYTPGLYPGANQAFHTGKDKGRSLLSVQGSAPHTYSWLRTDWSQSARMQNDAINTASSCVLYQR